MSASAVRVNKLLGQEDIDALAEQLAVVLEEGMAVRGLAFAAGCLQPCLVVFRTFLSPLNLSLLSAVLVLFGCLPCLHFVCGH